MMRTFKYFLLLLAIITCTSCWPFRKREHTPYNPYLNKKVKPSGELRKEQGEFSKRFLKQTKRQWRRRTKEKKRSGYYGE